MRPRDGIAKVRVSPIGGAGYVKRCAGCKLDGRTHDEYPA